MTAQAKRDKATIAELKATVAELLEVIAQKDRQIAQLQAEVASLKTEVKDLKAELQNERRRGKRSATPFSKKESNPHPKKPGRKPGEGHFEFKGVPEPTEAAVSVDVEGKYCSCGGERAHQRVEIVTIPPGVSMEIMPV